MEKRFDEETWLLANSSDNNAINIKEVEDEEETLSLVDLPHIKHSKTEQLQEKQSISHGAIEDFNFCRSFSLKSEMCTADEVFFQGQILPLRNSVSSEKGTRSISRSESMDRYYSGGLYSSRSSSLSSSSGSGSSSATHRPRHPKPPRNQFHSHPSPSPRIHKQGNFNFNPSNTNCNKKSSMWSIFRLGLLTPPPEIAFQEFKTRFPSKRSNSKKSTNSNSNSSTNSNSNSSFSVKNSDSGEKKKKRALFGAGCKCSTDAVDTVSSKVVNKNESELRAVKVKEERVIRSPTKKQISHHRTFEWLKQLSLEADREEA